MFSKHLLNGQHCATADEIIKCTPFHSQHHLIAEVKFADLNGISEKKAGILQVNYHSFPTALISFQANFSLQLAVT